MAAMDSDFVLNTSANYTNMTAGFTYEEIRILAICSVSMSSLSILGCVVSIMSTIIHYYQCQLLSPYHIIVAFLQLTDLLEVTGFTVIGSEIIQGWFPIPPLDCAIAAFFNQIGSLGSVIFTTLFFIHLGLGVVFMGKSPKANLIGKRVWLVTSICCIFSIICAMIPLLPTPVPEEGQIRFAAMGLVGAWCWIGGKWVAARYVLLYVAVFLSILIITFGSFYLIQHVWRKSTAFPTKKKLRLLKLLLFPLGLLVVWLPSIIVRFMNARGHIIPFWVSVLQALTIPSLGWINTILFFFNRRSIYQIKPVFSSKSKSSGKSYHRFSSSE